MAYFPMYQQLQNRNILIVGGGKVALRKAEALLPFGPRITVVAPEVLPRFRELGLTVERRPFRQEDVTGELFCVIAACSSREVNRQVGLLCREKSIPVNVADDPELCSFLFPSVVTKGPLTLGISTSGASPTAAKWLRETLEQLIPDSMEEILAWLGQQRTFIQSALPTPQQRSRCQRKLFAACMEQAGPLSHGQRDEIIAACRKNTEES